jgi:hypothetical protein
MRAALIDYPCGFRFGIGFALGALVVVAIAWVAINAFTP